MDTWITKENLFHMQTYRRLPVVFTKASGSKVWDLNGKQYLDFVAGLGVVNLGHGAKEPLNAFYQQSKDLIHVSNLFYTTPQLELAERLSQLVAEALAYGKKPMGANGWPKCFFANSGAEANEGAIKLARRYGRLNFQPERYEIITALNSFHGRTLKALAATGQKQKQEPFQPLPGGFVHVPFNDFKALKKVAHKKTAAVLLEIVQGEGGVYLGSSDYLQAVNRFCHENNILFIVDEVQTGMGRTGKLFAFEHYGLSPDIITLAKGLANGLPIGAFIAKPEVAKAFSPGDHGSTFGGGPAVAAAALATVNSLIKQKLPQKAASTGAYFKEQLIKLKESEPLIKEVRGLGLMLGIELMQPVADKVVVELLNKGFIINNIGLKILRFLPPLIITKKEIDKLVLALQQVLKERFWEKQ